MKTTVKHLFSFLLSSAITLFVMDLFIAYSYTENCSPTDYTEQYGRCRVANKQFVYLNEGFGIGHFNDGRYVGKYVSPDKPSSGHFRIAVLGDSYVEGFQVFERNHFTTILKNELSRKTGKEVEVLNFGRSGFDFGDMYALYDRMVKDYQCDVVLFFVSNADLKIDQDDVLISKVIQDVNKNIIITNEFFPKKYLADFLQQKWIAHNSTIYTMINNSRKLVVAGELNRKLFDKLVFESKVHLKETNSSSNKDEISDLSYAILHKLSQEDATIGIVNRDNRVLDGHFSDSIRADMLLIDLYSTSNLYLDNNPHYWKATRKTGHWNNQAHFIVAGELTSEMMELTSAKFEN